VHTRPEPVNATVMPEREVLERAAPETVEAWFQEASLEWLAGAYPAGAELPDRRAAESLEALASLIDLRHGDPWLRDAIHEARHSRLARRGFAELASAVAANAAGEPDRALASAHRAAASFDHAGAPAGWLRARFEEVYAMHRTLRPATCTGSAAGLIPELRKRSYRWALAQTWMEQASCEALGGHLDDAMRDDRESLAVVTESDYRGLALRALGMRAVHEQAVGNYRAAWQGNVEGLRSYWQGMYPLVRAYQFYVGLGMAAEAASMWHFAEAVDREAASIVSAIGNRSVETAQRFALAGVVASLGRRDEAEQEFAAAQKVLLELPSTPSRSAYMLEGAVSLAEIEARSGSADRALQRLTSVHDAVRASAFPLLGLRYYRLLGAAYLAKGQRSQAQRMLRVAAYLGERGRYGFASAAARVAWDRELSATYRSLVEIEYAASGDAAAAAAIWLGVSWPCRRIAAGEGIARLLRPRGSTPGAGHFSVP
jgi:hypothetical protein